MTKILTLPQTKAQLEAMLSFLQPLVDTENMATLGFGYGVCSTAGGTAAKTVDITDFILYKGAYISVLFQNAFTVTSPTLNVNNKGAKPIKLYGNAIAPGKVRANTVLTLVYDGTNWDVVAIQSQAAQSTQGAIDLGLPSGLLWAEHNVGAAKPEDVGLYFSWGNPTGHAEGSGYDFSQTNYDASAGAALTGDISVGDTYDMAHHNMGGQWRLPRRTEFQELYDNCDHEWIDEDGMYGMRFTSRVNGNSIFFPAAGFYDGTSLGNRGTLGYYWSSSYYSAASAYYLNFNSSTVNPQNYNNRRDGFSVRAVQ